LLRAPGRGRQETLAATLDWSHQLLAGDGQALWRRLAVFVGGWTLETAEAAGACFGLSPPHTVELLAQLVDCSLVVRQGHVLTARYRMLDLVRAYAWERLARASEQADALTCHRHVCADLASRTAARWWGSAQAEVMAQLEAEYDNFQAAIRGCIDDPSGTEAGLTLGADLQVLWVSRGHMADGRRQLGQLLERDTHATAARARATCVAGFLAMQLEDLAAARRWLTESVELGRAAADSVTTARALAYLSGAVAASGELDRALPLADDAVALAHGTADSYSIVIALNFRALLAARRRDFGHGAALFQEAVRVCEHDDERWMRQRQQQGLARCLFAQGQLDEAERHLRDSLDYAYQLQDWRGIANSVEGLGWAAITRENDRLGALLLGAADPIWQASVGGVSALWSEWHAESVRVARARMGERAFQAAWRDGAGLSMAEIVSRLLEHDAG
jgi:non-specific serine/threonine protein kinase